MELAFVVFLLLPNLSTIKIPRLKERSFTSPPQKINSQKSQGYFAKARELVTFYKNGLKQLWENQKVARQLKAKRDENLSSLTRHEFQLACIRTADSDRSKLIPFALVLITIPELLPLLVIMAPFLVPSTCVTPEQLEKRRHKLYEKQQTIHNEILGSSNVANLAEEDFQNLQRMIQLQRTVEGHKVSLKNFNSHLLKYFCKFMDLRTWGTRKMLQKRLEKHLDYIFEDDLMIQKEDVTKLTIDELLKASQERGIRCINISKSQMRHALDYWISLHLNEDPEISDFLLMFSRIFLLDAKYFAMENDSLSSGKKKKEIVAEI
ncbi:11437_t:CDS:2 [Ambispora gerdemannii]|uniref:11437_t:CDS:1 n=1 Tax=Ambispora gerdemannii TaxID=144530 RepID=A0A9N8V1I1_9GLOM|nr:11437_t:CDS:2 [Ambispora gerdemannii]